MYFGGVVAGKIILTPSGGGGHLCLMTGWSCRVLTPGFLACLCLVLDNLQDPRT